MEPKLEILHIDDNRGDLLLTKQAFERANVDCNISFAVDGEQGLNYLYRKGNFSNAKRPDIILLDLNMPILNGKELLRIVKNDDSLKSIPIIILTTSTSDLDVQYCYENHANAYVKKAVDFKNFFQSIRSISDFWFKTIQYTKSF